MVSTAGPPSVNRRRQAITSVLVTLCLALVGAGTKWFRMHFRTSADASANALARQVELVTGQALLSTR